MLPIFARELAPLRLHHSMMYRPIEHSVWKWACRRAFRACILGGGTLVFWQAFLDYFRVALDAGVPCYVLGTGVLDPDFWDRRQPEFVAGRSQWKDALNSCRFVGVRGEASRQTLSELGVRNVSVVGDPSLLLAGSGLSRTCVHTPPVLGLNWGTAYGVLWGDDEVEPRRALATAATHLANNGWRLRIYCVWPNDRKAVDDFTALLPARSWSLAEHYLCARDFIRDVSGCTVFAGMKLHSTALALCANVPSIMLAYRPKCEEFMRSVGLEELCVRVDTLSGKALASTLLETAERWPALRSTFMTATDALQGSLRSAMAMVTEQAGVQ